MRTTRRDETRRDEHCCQERSISIDSALKQNLWICPSVSDWNQVKFRWERNEFLSTPLSILHNGHTTHNNTGQLVQYRIDGWMNAEQVHETDWQDTRAVRKRVAAELRYSIFNEYISLLSNSPIKSWVDWWIGDDRSITSVSSRGPSPLSSFTVGHLWNVIMMMWRGTSHLNNIHNLHINRHWRDETRRGQLLGTQPRNSPWLTISTIHQVSKAHRALMAEGIDTRQMVSDGDEAMILIVWDH